MLLKPVFLSLSLFSLSSFTHAETIFSQNYDFIEDYEKISNPEELFEAKFFAEALPRLLRALENAPLEVQEKVSHALQVQSINETHSLGQEELWTYEIKIRSASKTSPIAEIESVEVFWARPLSENFDLCMHLESHSYDFTANYQSREASYLRAKQLGALLPQIWNAILNGCDENLKEELYESSKVLSMLIQTSGYDGEIWTYRLNTLRYASEGCMPEFGSLSIQERPRHDRESGELRYDRVCNSITLE